MNSHPAMITPRPYRTPADLAGMQALAQASHARARHSTLHPGDIPHRLFNVLRRYDPATIAWLWEDAGGVLAGWSIVYPPFGGFDSLVLAEHAGQAAAPDGEPLARAILRHAEGQTRAWLAREGRAGQPVVTDVFEGDTPRLEALAACGFAEDSHTATYTVRALDGTLPPATLPPGFTLRPVRGPEDAPAMVALRRGSFGSEWTEETYRALLRSPGYDPARELVIVAPDGAFAAHCTLWPDTANRIGLFEPVGTHADFRRLGLGRALLAAGLARLHAAGMVEAVVWHDATNAAAQRLYTAMGFRPHHRVLAFAKHA